MVEKDLKLKVIIYQIMKNYNIIIDGKNFYDHSIHSDIQQIGIVGQWKTLDNNDNDRDASNDQSMFVLAVLEKIKEKRVKLSRGSLTVLKQLVHYEGARVKLTST